MLRGGQYSYSYRIPDTRDASTPGCRLQEGFLALSSWFPCASGLLRPSLLSMDLFVAIGLLALLLLAVLYARRRQRPNLKLPEKLCSLVRAEFLPQTKVVDGLQFPLTLVPLAPDLDRLWFVASLSLSGSHGGGCWRGGRGGCRRH